MPKKTHGLGRGLDSLFPGAEEWGASIQEIPVGELDTNPDQPRQTFDDESIAQLADSIRDQGVLQPLLVVPFSGGRYRIIAGERRYRAGRLAGLETLPCIVKDIDVVRQMEIALIENLQRKDLHYLEEAEGYEKLVNTFHLTQESMAGRVGKKQSTIANKLRLLKLSPSVRNTLHESDLTERHARALLKLENEETQKTVLKKIIKDHLNVKQTEALIDKTLKQEGKLNKKKPRIVIVNDVRIYLNSIKNIMDAVKNSGIPSCMEQEMDGDDVVVTLRIKNVKKRKDPNVIKLF